ncbi:pseudaminic acid synthase [Marinilabiliaceae bacterium ANBcel2]|nr:pseudaminic acid synthase [Marinilabiliaceae bacterium ANBcel2]
MSKTFIIAELSANHNNNFDIAAETIRAIAKAGADAVKVQTYKPESLTLDMDSGYFAPRTEGLWKDYTPWKLYSQASMPYQWQPKLKEIAEEVGLIFFSSPFDNEGVDFLESIGNPIYKIASLEINDTPLIEYAASKGKPMIISTGVAEADEIADALAACRKVGNNNVTLLKCTSQYPATIADANLATIPEMQNRFNVDIGVSDHTQGSIVPVVAVSLGAKIVEKHFTLDRAMGGPDAPFSMEPHEFAQMVKDVRDTESALGVVTYNVNEKDKLRRRSLFVIKNILKGEKITKENIRSIRPGHGIHPGFLSQVVGKIAKIDIARGTPLDFDHFE